MVQLANYPLLSGGLPPLSDVPDPAQALAGGTLRDPFALSVAPTGMGGGPSGTVEGSLQKQTPRSVVFGQADPAAQILGPTTNQPGGFKVPPPPPDPATAASDAASKEAIAKLEQAQNDYLNSLRNASNMETAFGAKLANMEDLMAASMRPFQPPKERSPFEGWGAAAMVFASIGSLFTRTPMTTALNAMAGVINATRKGNQEELDNSMAVWKANSEQAMKLADFEIQAYKTALEGVSRKVELQEKISDAETNEAMSKWMATSAALGDSSMQQVLMAHGLTGGQDWLAKRIEAQAKYAEASNKLEDQIGIQQALAEYDRNPANANKSAGERSEDKKQIMNQYGSGTPLSDQAINDAAMLYAAGGPFRKMATEGMVYSGASRADRSKIINRAAQISTDEAMASAPVQAALKSTERAKQVAILAQVAAKVQFRANNALQASALVKQASHGVPRGTLLPANFFNMTLEEMQSDPRLATYYVRVNSFINDYASAINMGGPPRIWDKQHATELINKYGGVEYVDAAMDALQMELRIAVNAPDILQRLLIEHPNEPIGELLWQEEQKTERSMNLSGGGTAEPSGFTGFSATPVTSAPAGQ